MDEEEDYRPKQLANQRTIEDQQRDDIIALTYMNSREFGKGIDVSGTAKRVVNDPQEADVQIVAPTRDAPPESQTVSTTIPDEELEQAPLPYTERLEHTSKLPPEEPLPELEEFGVGGFERIVGGGEPEAPPPDPPILALNPIEEIGTEEVFIPATTQLVDLPKPAQSLEPTPSPPPIDAAAIPFEAPEPLPEPEEKSEPPAMPWLQQPEMRVMPAFEKDGVQQRIEEYTPETMSIEAMETFARTHVEYIESVTGILLDMSERVDEAIARIKELEAGVDRRYRRRYH